MLGTSSQFILSTFEIYYQHSITISISFQKMVTVAALAFLILKREKRNKGGSEGEGGRKALQGKNKRGNKEERTWSSMYWGENSV